MLHQQAWSFAVAILAGIAAGVIIDIYEVSRSLLGLRKIGTTVGDVLTWLLVSLVAFILLLVGNWAELRLYVVLALAGGLIIYMRAASPYSRKAIRFTFKAMHWGIVMLVKLVLLPFKTLIKLLEIPWRLVRGLVLLLLRIAEYGVSFPQVGLSRWYKNFKQRITPPPDI